MMGYGGAGWGGMGWGGVIGMVLVWVVLIGLIVWAATRLLPSRRGGNVNQQSVQDTPEEMLERRFARGEIDLENYQAQRAALASARGERR